MRTDISPQLAGLVGGWCCSLLYGITVIVYFTCLYIFVEGRKHRPRSATWVLFVTTTIQFILATVYVGFGLRRLIEGFIETENIPGGAMAYWINPSNRAQVVSKGVYVTNSIIGDSIMVWRVYMVYGRDIFVALVPGLLVVATAATGYISLAKLNSITETDIDSIFLILRWMLATWSLSIATQTASTLLITGKLWLHARRNPILKSLYISPIVIIVESGAIYTVATIFLLAFFYLRIQAGAIIGDMVTQIATIVPTLVIIRVELNRRRYNTGTTFAKHSELHFAKGRSSTELTSSTDGDV